MAQAVELQRIFKYPLTITDKQFVEVPMYATPLKVAFQDGQLYMWCQVTPSREKNHYSIYIFGTGHELPYVPLNYLETVFDVRGYVWHVYLGVD